MKKVSLVITDLDNTLWDWFGMWHARFSAMLDELHAVTSIPREELIREIQQIHQKHHTSEYAFVLQELDCLRKHLGREVDARKDFPTVIEKSQEARRKVANTFLTVKETLQAIKARGARIVAFTESQIFYTSQRIREFGLDGIIDVLYSTPDQSTLSPEEVDKARKHPADFYELKKTIVRALPDRLVKPSPDILTTILNDEKASLANSIYIGDSLTKDIAMAADCGVTSVYAEYGVSTYKKDYDLLRQVTHWNEAAVEKERHTTQLQVQPDITLKHVFSEVMLHFDFTSCSCCSDADVDREVDIWKESVATQRHFNDLQLSLRGILVTLVTGIIGGAGYALTQHSELVVLGLPVNLGAVIALTGIVAVIAIRHFDRGYHDLLVGAVIN